MYTDYSYKIIKTIIKTLVIYCLKIQFLKILNQVLEISLPRYTCLSLKESDKLHTFTNINQYYCRL